MNRRALLAVSLSVAVLVIWQAFVLPRPRPVPPVASPAAGAAATAPQEQAAPADASTPPPAPAAESVSAEKRSEFIVETEYYAVRFSNEGGRILSWRLLNYVDDLKAPLELISRNASSEEDFPLRVVIPGDAASTRLLDGALFREEVRDAAPADEWPGAGFKGHIVLFSWSDGRGLDVTKKLAIPAAGYVNHVQVDLHRDGKPVPAEITWAVGLPESPDDKTSRYFHTEDQGVIQVGEESPAERFPADGVTETKTFPGTSDRGVLHWGGLESTYFASLIIPEESSGCSITLVPVRRAAPGAAEPGAPAAGAIVAARIGTSGAARFMTLVGPKDFDLLAGMGRHLDHAIDFSRWGLIYAVTKYLFLALRWTNGFIGNYGVSIVLLTIAIRSAFFPLTYRSAISMRQNAKKMGKIQPRVKAIQERYRKLKKSMETQREMNDEIMAVYKKEGLNPMGSLQGCLPLLLQMPVFIAFYNLLSVTIELRGAPLAFWIRDLSRMDPYYISPILMGISWMVQQHMTSNTIADPMQRRMMGMMPILFTFMMARMPSGLVIYWLVSNVIGLAQQYVINRTADATPAPEGGA